MDVTNEKMFKKLSRNTIYLTLWLKLIENKM